MLTTLKALLRHFKTSAFGPVLGANLACLLPFVVSLLGPVLLAGNLPVGLVVLLTGFTVTGQTLAVTGRVLDRRFRGEKPSRGDLLRAWRQAWHEGLVMAGILVGLFSLAFSSVPYYWAQGTLFSTFSLVTLGVGTLLILGGLPYYLPVRRREGLGLWAAVGRSFRLMNARPGVALATGLLGALALALNVVSLGLVPGFGGIAALHQGAYDTVTEAEKD